MEVSPRKLEGSFSILLKNIPDHRGFFMRSYDKQIFQRHGLALDWLYENH